MAAVVAFFLGPIGRYVGIGLVIVSLLGGVYFKGRHDEHTAFQARIDREHQEAVRQGRAARDSAVERFDNGGLRDDGFARD